MQMAEITENCLLIQEVETHNIMTKSSLPVGGYSATQRSMRDSGWSSAR